MVMLTVTNRPGQATYGTKEASQTGSAEGREATRKGSKSMAYDIEETRLSRRKLLGGAAGVAGSLAAGTVWSPELARAIPRRRLAATTVTLMTNNGEISNQDIADFQNKNPNINIQWIVTDGPRFQAMMAAGTPPDLFRVQAPLVPQFAK